MKKKVTATDLIDLRILRAAAKDIDWKSKTAVDQCSVSIRGNSSVQWIFQTPDTYAFLFLRFGLAVTFFMHGTQHAFGWHGGKGPKAQVTNWRDKYGIPVPMGVLALVIELSTVLCMALGFFVRPVALGLAVFMAFATFLSHWEHGFFLSSGAGRGSGIEYTMALMLMALTVAVGGAGALSVDIMLGH